MPRKQQEELVGVITFVRWPIADSDFVFGAIDDDADDSPLGTTKEIKFCGSIERGEILEGVEYLFVGTWDQHSRYGRQFKFKQAIRREPHSQFGLTKYLERYAKGIGPKRAIQLWNAFGQDAVKTIRTDPALACSAVDGWTIGDALKASEDLRKLQAEEETRIELTNLFAGRGFPGKLVDECIDRWGIMAPKRIKRDPFSLLVNGMKGCGFARCDRLYLDLGLNPLRLKRQVICAWHLIHSDMSGHTWLPARVIVLRLGEMVGNSKASPEKAVKIGVRAGWLAVCQREGQTWIADGENAWDETALAEKIAELSQGGTNDGSTLEEGPGEGRRDGDDDRPPAAWTAGQVQHCGPSVDAGGSLAG